MHLELKGDSSEVESNHRLFKRGSGFRVARGVCLLVALGCLCTFGKYTGPSGAALVGGFFLSGLIYGLLDLLRPSALLTLYPSGAVSFDNFDGKGRIYILPQDEVELSPLEHDLNAQVNGERVVLSSGLAKEDLGKAVSLIQEWRASHNAPVECPKCQSRVSSGVASCPCGQPLFATGDLSLGQKFGIGAFVFFFSLFVGIMTTNSFLEPRLGEQAVFLYYAVALLLAGGAVSTEFGRKFHAFVGA